MRERANDSFPSLPIIKKIVHIIVRLSVIFVKCEINHVGGRAGKEVKSREGEASRVGWPREPHGRTCPTQNVEVGGDRK
jgi:hypothetical protein